MYKKPLPDHRPPEDRNLHRFQGMNLDEVKNHLYADPQKLSDKLKMRTSKPEELSSIFEDFLAILRNKELKVSVPEWLQFLTLVQANCSGRSLLIMLRQKNFLPKLRIWASITLLKDKSYEAAFHEAFEEYFGVIVEIFRMAIKDQIDSTLQAPEQVAKKEADNNKTTPEEELSEQTQTNEETDEQNNPAPEQKEQLGITDVAEDLELPENSPHRNNEQVHGGKEDQHNDILHQADLSKAGGGTKDHKQAENKQITPTEEGILTGGGKGKSIIAIRVAGEKTAQHISSKDYTDFLQKRKRHANGQDRRKRYSVRPDINSLHQIILSLRRIIIESSSFTSSKLDIKKTVQNFARRNFRFDYQVERKKEEEIVLLIDVGGPVDQWSPLIREISQKMSKGLTKLEIYFFHNNLYGYVWPAPSKNAPHSNYTQPNSLLDIKKIIKKRKKVIVYGDAEMSYSEFLEDGWPPEDNDQLVRQFEMSGPDCLNFIKRTAQNVVWVNPIFQNEWEERDYSESLRGVQSIIPMYDLSLGGIEDAIKYLVKK